MRWLVVLAVALWAWIARPVDALANHSIPVDQFGDPSPPPQDCSPAFTDCSLRGAILAATSAPDGPHTVTLPLGTYTLSIAGVGEDNGLTGDLDINASMTIQGISATATTIVAGASSLTGIDRVFHVRNGATLTLNKLAVSHGTAPSGTNGGGILIDPGASAVLNSAHITDNAAERGAGIANGGALTLEGSAVSANITTLGGGAGIFALDTSTSTSLMNSTISGNTAADQGSALQVAGGAVSLRNATVAVNSTRGADATDAGVLRTAGTITSSNTIIAGNTNQTGANNCSGTLASAGHNLSSDSTCGFSSSGIGDIQGTDAKLEPLRDADGLAPFHYLLPGSPALDAGSSITPGSGSGACESVDQMGTSRSLDGDNDGVARCDIGAVETRVFVVDTPADEPGVLFQACTPAPGDCSLRGAVIRANGGNGIDGGVISLPAGTYTFDEAGIFENAAATGDLDVLDALSIVGASADSTIIQAGSSPGTGIDRVIQVLNTGSLYLSNVTIQYGRGTDAFGGAGGIDSDQGWVYLSDVKVFQNTSSVGSGGGVSGGKKTTILRSSILNNSATAASGVGGGVATGSNGSTTIIDSTVSGNSAPGGGGLAAAASGSRLTVTGSTISGNTTSSPSGGGAGILMGASAQSVTLSNDTISGNTSAGGASGIRRQGSAGSSLAIQNVTLASNSSSANGSDAAGLDVAAGAPITLINSIVASNTNAGGPRNCNGAFTSGGNNLSNTTECPFESTGIGDQEGVNVSLGPLQNNGGFTLTHSPLPGSPAIDTGNAATPGSGGNACSALDQRGVARPQNGDNAGAAVCDKGSVEFVNPCLTRPPVGVSVSIVSGNLLRATITSGFGAITSLHLGTPVVPENARINVQGGPQNVTGEAVYNAASAPALPPNTTQLIIDSTLR